MGNVACVNLATRRAHEARKHENFNLDQAAPSYVLRCVFISPYLNSGRVITGLLSMIMQMCPEHAGNNF